MATGFLRNPAGCNTETSLSKMAAPLRTMIGIEANPGSRSCACRNCQPLITGITRSKRMTDGRVLISIRASSAAFPSPAHCASKPNAVKISKSTSRVAGSSSTIRSFRKLESLASSRAQSDRSDPLASNSREAPMACSRGMPILRFIALRDPRPRTMEGSQSPGSIGALDRAARLP